MYATKGDFMQKRDRQGRSEQEFLQQYQESDYKHPSVASDVVIFTVSEEEKKNYRKLPQKKLCILMVQRGVHPYLGMWALPGGFVRPDETTEQAAVRELKEETGIDHLYLEQLYTFSDPNRDPRTWVMSCSYLALIDSRERKLQAGDDADQADWFTIQYQLIQQKKVRLENGYEQTNQYELKLEKDSLTLLAIIEESSIETDQISHSVYRMIENNGFAFDHGKIIAYALQRLRGKIEYTDLALNLMPKQFTLTELQQVYEVILGKELLKAAFRRKIANLVEETENYTENAGHRPSRLFQRRKKVF